MSTSLPRKSYASWRRKTTLAFHPTCRSMSDSLIAFSVGQDFSYHSTRIHSSTDRLSSLLARDVRENVVISMYSHWDRGEFAQFRRIVTIVTRHVLSIRLDSIRRQSWIFSLVFRTMFLNFSWIYLFYFLIFGSLRHAGLYSSIWSRSAAVTNEIDWYYFLFSNAVLCAPTKRAGWFTHFIFVV